MPAEFCRRLATLRLQPAYCGIPLDESTLMIAYDRQTVANPSLIKRLSHRARFDVAVRLLAPEPGMTVLDYGTGDGLLLSYLAHTYPQAKCIGFEPVQEMSEQAQSLLTRTGTSAQLLTDRRQLRDLGCQRLCCMEVMEHLDEAPMAQAFADFRHMLAPEGKLLISVPVEIGASALAKNFVRGLNRQTQEGTSLRTVLAATLGLTDRIPRLSRGGYIDSHLGFDYRRLRRRVQQEGFVIERQTFGPMPWLGAALNSQVFWLCRLG